MYNLVQSAQFMIIVYVFVGREHWNLSCHWVHHTPSPTIRHISLKQISEHPLRGACPSLDWGPIHDIHTLDRDSPMTNITVGGLMDLHVHRIDGRVVLAVYVPCYRWPKYGVSNSD